MLLRLLTKSTATLVLVATGPAASHAASAADEAPPARNAAAGGTPAIFDTRPYAEAKKAAEDEGKWFIVKGTAVWCGPCRVMDRTTWVDPKVVEWLEANAVVYSLDVDKEASVARSLGIQPIPTMIAFKEGKEFDRIVGARPPEPFLEWLEGIERGETSIEAVADRAKRPAPDGNVDIRARYEHAQALARSRKADAIDEATEEFAWLWKNMLDHDPGFSGVRSSFMASDMERLAQRSPKAKARFTALRDETARALDGPKIDPELLDDWIVLNGVIGDEDATLKWFDRVKNDRRWKPLFERSSFRLVELLREHDRWADLGALIDDPKAQVRKDHEFMEHVKALDRRRNNADPELDATARAIGESVTLRRWHESAGRTYASVLADGREEAALDAALEAMRLDPDPALLEALVTTALEAGQPRAAQLEWIDAALARRGTDPHAADAALTPVRAERLRILRPKVEKALADAKPAAGAGAGAAPAP